MGANPGPGLIPVVGPSGSPADAIGPPAAGYVLTWHAGTAQYPDGFATWEPGGGGGAVTSVFGEVGNALPGWSVTGGTDLHVDPAGQVVSEENGQSSKFIDGQYRWDGDGGRGAGVIDSNFAVESQPGAGVAAFHALGGRGGTVALNAEGLALKKLGPAAAPADGELAASTFTFWLDATNGAPVLHIKAKQADGTVVGAAIPLA